MYLSVKGSVDKTGGEGVIVCAVPKPLVIVESPAKARTIEGFLGGDFTVLASMGHIRDLPAKGLSVDVGTPIISVSDSAPSGPAAPAPPPAHDAPLYGKLDADTSDTSDATDTAAGSPALAQAAGHASASRSTGSLSAFPAAKDDLPTARRRTCTGATSAR